MGNMHPSDLHQLMRTWLLAEDPYGLQGGGPSGRIEPPMGRAPPNEAAIRNKKQQAAFERQKLARGQGESAVERALAPGARAEPDATGESTRAFGTEAVDQAMDKEMTQQWIDRMRASKAGKAKARSGRAEAEGTDAVARELDPIGAQQWQRSFISQGATEVPPPSEVVARQTGEDAVRNALTDMNMKPLIDQTLQAQAIRDAIASHMANPPEMPESSIPENTNRPPGSENSYVSAHDYSLLPESSPGVRGILNTPPLAPPRMPRPANTNTPGGFPVDEQGNALDQHGNIIPGGHPVDELGHPAYPLFSPGRPPDPNLPQGPRERPGDPEADKPTE